MKALTLTQPWASLVAIGAKRLETRSWRTNYRGSIAIHAAKGMPRGARHLFYCAPFAQTFADARDRGEMPDGVFECDRETGWQGYAERLPRGAVVAVAFLEGVRLIEADGIPEGVLGLTLLKANPHEEAFGDFTPGRFAWVLRDVRALAEPIPWKGALGLWDLPDDVLARQAVA